MGWDGNSAFISRGTGRERTEKWEETGNGRGREIAFISRGTGRGQEVGRGADGTDERSAAQDIFALGRAQDLVHALGRHKILCHPANVDAAAAAPRRRLKRHSTITSD